AYWLEQGVDGFRLDAVTSYYTESKEKSIAFLGWFTQMVKELKADAYLVGEAWADVSVYASYYESGIDSLFDFAFSGPEGVIAAATRGKRPASWYGQKLVEEEDLFSSYKADYVRAPFYTNHDMGRGAGYYTRDDGSRAKLALALHLLMPGKVFLYYGEELGMKGSGRDENKRAPMYWAQEGEGLCQGPPEMEEVTMKYGPLEQQEEDPSSIYTFAKTLLSLRRAYPVIGEGKTVLLEDLSGKEACVLLRRETGEEFGKEVLLAYNTAEEEITLDLGAWEETEGADCLLAGGAFARGGQARYEDDILTLPSMGVAVLEVLKTP
ncbi:MAG: alpha-amylase, partial [Blautia sp.]|nr:alpha-amylase [Blautia sp.]